MIRNSYGYFHFRPSDATHGHLFIERGRPRSIFRYCIPKQSAVVHYELFQWTNYNGRAEGELHRSENFLQFNRRFEVILGVNRRKNSEISFCVSFFAEAKVQRWTVNMLRRWCSTQSTGQSICMDCIVTIIYACGPHELANVFPLSIAYLSAMSCAHKDVSDSAHSARIHKIQSLFLLFSGSTK